MLRQRRRRSLRQRNSIPVPCALKSPEVNRVRNVVRPYIRFRRIARAVALLVKICNICKRIVYESVASQDWFTLIGRFVEGDEKFFEDNTAPRPRPFITFVVNDDKKGDLTQLSFDKSEFSRENRSEHLLTADIRKVLRITPNLRTVNQQNELVRFLKRLSPEFNAYPMESQRRLAKCLYYDRYYPSRVLARQGLMADTVFFVLSGTVVEKTEDRRGLRELRPGDRFGEEDIICACPRRSTAVTKTTVELLSVHRIDYRAIFNMADDSNNPKYLDICRHDVVFQHFPMKKLIENPGTWAVLSYKFGRLMVKDSNDMDWIYIIKSGEARILRHMTTTHLDIDARRKKKQQRENDEKNTKKLIEFVGGKQSIPSQYKTSCYSPKVAKRAMCSAPIHRSTPVLPEPYQRSLSQQNYNLYSRTQDPTDTLRAQLDALPAHNMFRVRPQSQPAGCQEKDDVTNEHLKRSITTSRAEDRPQIELTPPDDLSSESSLRPQKTIRIVLPDDEDPEKVTGTRGRKNYIQTPHNSSKLPPLSPRPSHTSKDSTPNVRRVPPFVQLECIRAGKVFGLRSCLELAERGPSVSLVSAGCEVLQINKKFFAKHADEAVMGLIRAMYKAFPSEEEMLERLDDSLQWQEYRESTVRDFLKQKGRLSTQYSTVHSIT